MKEKERVIFDILDSSFPGKIEFLPMGDDPLRYLVRVILSLSSTDRMAEFSSKRLFERFKTAEEIARADETEIAYLIRQSGLERQKSEVIKRTAQYFLEKGIPKSREELLSIKGIGEKSASCFIQSVLGGNAIVVDTHVLRVSYRIGLTTTKNRDKAMHELERNFDEELWNRLSDTLGALGRSVCRPRPKCMECILKENCIKRIE